MYDLWISEEAREQIRGLPEEMRRNVGQRLRALQDGLSGDVKKLSGSHEGYRLRVGSLRVLFKLRGARIEVHAVRQRKDAYD